MKERRLQSIVINGENMSVPFSNPLPRILLITSGPLSSDSNGGRTISYYFEGWPSDHLANLRFAAGSNDLLNCQVFQITDSDALDSVIKCHFFGGVVTSFQPADNDQVAVIRKKKKDSPLLGLLREIVWFFSSFHFSSLYHWARQLSPNIIVVFPSNRAHLAKIACSISKKTGAKIVTFNTEDYPLKVKSYFLKENGFSWLFPFWQHYLFKWTKKMMKMSLLNIFNSDLLLEAFRAKMPFLTRGKCALFYPSTTFVPQPHLSRNDRPLSFLYVGNCRVGRTNSLLSFAEVLFRTGISYTFDVFASGDEEDIARLKLCKNLSFHDPVPFAVVRELYKKSDVIVIVESFDSFFISDSRYMFSTKIPDCLASGRCCIYYGPTSYAEADYLLKNKAAYVSSSESSLTNIIFSIEKSEKQLERYVENAAVLAEKNHSFERNKLAFQSLLVELNHNKN